MTPPISYELTTEERSDHVFARIRSIGMTPDVAPRFLREAKNVLIDSRQARLLLELELAHALSENDAVGLVEEFSRTLAGLRVAVVNRDPRHHLPLLFGISSSCESGQDFGYFTDNAAAVAWLTSAE